MNELRHSIQRVKEDAGAARAYFHTWWALRNRAIPDYLDVMNDYSYVDFFHVANSGFLKLTFISLGKVFDLDDRAIGQRQLRELLSNSGYPDKALIIEHAVSKHTKLVRKVKNIRNKSVGHNEASLTRDEVYKRYGVTANEIRELVDDICNALNEVDEQLGSINPISDGERHENAVLSLLEALRSRAS